MSKKKTDISVQEFKAEKTNYKKIDNYLEESKKLTIEREAANRKKAEEALKQFPIKQRKPKFHQFDEIQAKVMSFEEEFDKKLVSIVRILKKENLNKTGFFERVMNL